MDVIISCAIFVLVLVVLAESFVIYIALHLFILVYCSSASSESPPINTDQLQTRLQTSDCDRGSTLSGSPIRGLDTKSVDVVGRGSFANVKSCVYKGEKVARKEFKCLDSFRRECKIIKKIKGHKYIVDIKSSRLMESADGTYVTGVFLMHLYICNLTKYLKSTVVDIATASKFCSSLLCGLEYLHDSAKIAHCDMKSANVLISSDQSLVISDFGLALQCDSSGCVDTCDVILGTNRYLSPEILRGAADLTMFSTHTAHDVYATGLVMWEVLNVVSIDGKAEQYSLPYSMHVPSSPTKADMMRVVVDQNIRPQLPVYIQQCSELHTLVNGIYGALGSKESSTTV